MDGPVPEGTHRGNTSVGSLACGSLPGMTTPAFPVLFNTLIECLVSQDSSFPVVFMHQAAVSRVSRPEGCLPRGLARVTGEIKKAIFMQKT